jgi:hypothetical protein
MATLREEAATAYDRYEDEMLERTSGESMPDCFAARSSFYAGYLAGVDAMLDRARAHMELRHGGGCFFFYSDMETPDDVG